jgi:uncharacterized membrane protein YhfC
VRRESREGGSVTGGGLPGIYLMLVPTLTLSALAWGGLIYALSGRQRGYLWLVLPALPLSAAINMLVKRPLVVVVAQSGGFPPGLRLDAPLWYLAFLLLLAPVTEEAIKALPLLWPKARQRVSSPKNALWAGMSLGLGFGLGEAAFLAYGVGLNSTYAEVPWYLFAGFLQERFMVCLAHAMLTGIVVGGWQRGSRSSLLGYAAAVALHAAVNVGAMLYQLRLITDWTSQASLMIALVLLVAIFIRLQGVAGREHREAERGEARPLRVETGQEA